MYTQDFFTVNIPNWEVIFSRVKGRKLEAIELGSFEGRSTVWLLENILTHPQSRITCIDPFTSDAELKEANWNDVKRNFLENTEPFKDKIVLVEDTSAHYMKTRAKKADIIYVDGSHKASDVLIDAIQSHLLLNQGGLLVFDDYIWSGLQKRPDTPKGAIDSFLDNFATDYTIINLGYQVALQKI